MPVTKFTCPSGQRISIKDCLRSCPNQQRCMFLPTLRAVAKSLDRNTSEPTVTELIINEQHTQGAILSEERLKDEITSGQFDLFGKILDNDEGVLGDLKVTSSFKLMKALGIYKQKVPTGEVYKSGIKKGQPKFRSELRFDGVRDLLDWAIQALCRDSGLRIAAERGIDKPVYIIPINKISDHWLQCYFHHKAKAFQDSISSKTLPPVCSFRERWGNKKCLGYCAARENCPYAQQLTVKKEVAEDEYTLSA